MSGDFKSLFQTVRRLRSAENWCVYIATTFLVFELFATIYNAVPAVVSCCQIATCILAVISLLIGLLSDQFLYQAEEEKRKDLLDNAFGTHLSEHDSNSYYSNETTPKGIKKLAVNNYESSFFTQRILSAGMGRQIALFISVLLVFVVVSLLANRDAVVLLLQLALPVNIIVEFVRYCSTYYRVKKLTLTYRMLFDNNKQPRPADLLLNVLNYTAALAYGKTLLDEKKYNQMNESLSLEWENIRKSLNLD